MPFPIALSTSAVDTYAEMQLKSALLRKESRGGTCLREDYPFQDNKNWLKWISLRQSHDKMTTYTRDLKFDRYSVKPPAEKSLDPLWQLAKSLGLVTVKEERVVWE